MSREIPMLEKNAKVLATRFPVVLDRILKTGNRLSDNFFYEDKSKSPILMMQRGEHAFPVYGNTSKSKLVKRWFEGLKLEGSHYMQLLDLVMVPIFDISLKTLLQVHLYWCRKGCLSTKRLFRELIALIFYLMKDLVLELVNWMMSTLPIFKMLLFPQSLM